MPTPQWQSLAALIDRLQPNQTPIAASVLGIGNSATPREIRAAAYHYVRSHVSGRDMAQGYADLEAKLQSAIATGHFEPASAPVSAYVPQAVASEPEPKFARVAPKHPGSVQSAAEALATAIAAMGANQPLDADAVREIVRSEISGMPATRIEVVQSGQVTHTITGAQHPALATLIQAASVRLGDGYHPNIWIAGPAGSGKTSGAFKTFEALGLTIEHNGALSMPHELLGYRHGPDYFETAFFRGYTGKCGYLFDDIDGSDANVLVALNGALANGHATFPHGRFSRHPDSLIIATANTWGAGATSDFVGRNKLDAAFLDRFPVKIFWGYDEKFERDLFGAQAADIVQDVRRVATQRGIKGVLITPRCTAAIAALLAAGVSIEAAKDLTYRASLTAEQRKQVP